MLYNLLHAQYTNFRTKLECLLEYAGKACLGQSLYLIMKIYQLQTKKFYNIGPRSAALQSSEDVLVENKRNLRAIYIKAESLFNLCQFEHAMVHFHRGWVRDYF